MAVPNKAEVWLRGPIENIPELLQPVAHALLQAREEVNELLGCFSEDLLWEKPAAVASVGFHLQHLTGVLDRLFTYAAGESLSEEQLQYLSAEGEINPKLTVATLLQSFNQRIDRSLTKLSNTNEAALREKRGVGRSQMPSTVLGLLVHAAEHTMRHAGQLHVTVKITEAVKRGEITLLKNEPYL